MLSRNEFAGKTLVEIAVTLNQRRSMKMFIILIAVASLATGCATYSDRGAPGYPTDIESGSMRSTPTPPAWPGVQVGTPSGSMHPEKPLP